MQVLDVLAPAGPSPAVDSDPPEPLLAFVPATETLPPPPTTVRCPCCGLRASRPSADDGSLCSGQCVRCGGSCLGLLQQAAAPPAPPLAVRPVEDFNWTMRN